MKRRSRLRAATLTVSILLCLFAYQEAFGQTALTNNVTVTNISQSAGGWNDYYIDVPAGMSSLKIETWGGTGDADLYVKRGSLPTTSTWDYRSWAYGNTETITIYNPVAARYYIRLYAYTAFSGVSLRAMYGIEATAVIPLTNGVTVTNISGAQNQYRPFDIVVPAGTSSLKIETWGGTGDADLYVRRDGPPSTSTWDYRSWNYGNNETITINNPVSGSYEISLYGYTAFSGVSLRATYVAGPTALINGVAFGPLSGATGSMAYYYIDIPSGQTSLTIQTWGGTGDCDLYVRYGSTPTTSSYGYRSWASGNTESITINNPTSGRWYIGLHGYSSYTNLYLRARSAATITPLLSGWEVGPLSGATGSMDFYYIYVPSGQATLTIQTWGGTGDCDLYVRYGSTPTTSSYGYRSWASGNTESITINNPTSGYWHIGLHAYSGYSGLYLRATYSAGATALSNMVPATSISGAAGSWRYYYIDVPSGQASLQIMTYGGTGDCDLYVRRGSLPTLETYDYRPYLTGNNETVTIQNPTMGRYYIGLRGWSAYSGVTLHATYSFVPALVNGATVTSLGGSVGTWKDFYIFVPPGRSSLTIQIWGGTGDADLYVRLGSLPTLVNWDYRPYLTGNNESVTINNPASGYWYISLRGFNSYADVSLRAYSLSGTWAI
jgi:hypothetical protein